MLIFRMSVLTMLLLRLSAFLVVICGLVGLMACNGGKNQTNIELIQNMMDQRSIKAQDWDPQHPNKAMMLLPPENTIPRNKTPYPYHLDYQSAEKNLKNPYAGDNTPDILIEGKKYFGIYCAVCHGSKGAGDGPVAEKMAAIRRPPSLLSQQVRDYSDARLFHIITDGQGLMSGYASQISDEKKRWTIVNYLRTLQKSSSP